MSVSLIKGGRSDYLNKASSGMAASVAYSDSSASSSSSIYSLMTDPDALVGRGSNPVTKAKEGEAVGIGVSLVCLSSGSSLTVRSESSIRNKAFEEEGRFCCVKGRGISSLSTLLVIRVQARISKKRSAHLTISYKRRSYQAVFL